MEREERESVCMCVIHLGQNLGCSAFEEHSGTREHTSTEAQVSPYHVLTLEDENMFLFGFAFNYLITRIHTYIYVATGKREFMRTGPDSDSV